MLAILGRSLFVPIPWMCKKQAAISHYSSEAEIVALDAAVLMEGIPALGLLDLVIGMFHPQPKNNSDEHYMQRGIK